MELIYIWIDKFRNFEKQAISLSGEFEVNYLEGEERIEIYKEEQPSIYPPYIKNINVIIGKNGVGKTNILDLIGLRIGDRNKNGKEYEEKFEKTTCETGVFKDMEFDLLTGVDVYSNYFFIYYFGKNDIGEDLYYFEGNNITKYSHLFWNYNPESNNFKSKMWFLYECTFEEGKFRISNQCVNEVNNIGIISLREILNKKYYDDYSTETNDESLISIPRRIGKFKSQFIYKEFEMLYHYLSQKDRKLFENDEYILNISFNKHFLISAYNHYQLSYSYSDCIDNNMQERLEVIEAFIYFYYAAAKRKSKQEGIDYNVDSALSEIKMNDYSVQDFLNYYLQVFKIIISKIYVGKEDMREYTQTTFEEFIDIVTKTELTIMEPGNLKLKLTKDTEIIRLTNVIRATIDEPTLSDVKEMPSAFTNFFNYSIDNISDGEKAYLGFYSSLSEQLDLFTKKKSRYIILLDEPETRLHPELARNFINDLIKFLEVQKEKMFQIIISSHSPFILSDTLKDSVVCVKKESNQRSIITKEHSETFGANIHQLFKKSFFMNATLGEYAVSKINEIIDLIRDEHIHDLSTKEKEKYLFIINSIGENLISNQLRRKFNDKFNQDPEKKCILEELDRYKSLLKEMEKDYLIEEKRDEWKKKTGKLYD